MDRLSDLMKDQRPREPAQLKALRDYVKTNHKASITASVSRFGYTIVVPNAPLAANLRMETPQIQIECNLDKKLFIRIGS